jgi:hypothetical protein
MRQPKRAKARSSQVWESFHASLDVYQQLLSHWHFSLGDLAGDQPTCDKFPVMKISGEQAIECLNRWKQAGTVVGLHFAARGGTAGSTMLARITEVGARIVFKNESSVLRFALYKAHFEFGPVQVLLRPSREGLAQIDGLHIWLESGHWLFVCDGQGIAQDWLESSGLAAERKSSGLLESQHDSELAFQGD